MNNTVLSLIGNTPLVEMCRVFPDAGFRLFAKLEGLNPGGSAKDRSALGMIRGALESGAINSDTVIIESSSGNMGIGLAQVCRCYGLRFICVVDPRTAPANLQLLRVYGAQIEYVAEPDPETGDFLCARLKRVRTLLAEIPNSFWTNQYANRHNSEAHYHSTISEIVAALGRIDYLFCATSTCGTIRGCSEYLSDHGHSTTVVGVDAVGSVIFGQERAKRIIPGLGAGIVPALFEPGLVDECVFVSDLDCVVGCRRLMREEALLVGGSAGGVLTAIDHFRPRIPDGAVCAAIFHDRGDRYLDTIFNDDWVLEHFGEVSHLWADGPRETPMKEIEACITTTAS